MKILTIGSDRQLFVAGSEVRQRMAVLASVLAEMHIIVFTRRPQCFKIEKIASNVWIYPTNSLSRLFYLWDAVRLGRRFRHGVEIVSGQDPFECGLAAWLVSRHLNAKWQLQIHTDLGSPYFWQESVRNKIRYLLANFLLPRTDGIRVVSARIKNFLTSHLQLPASKITILPVFVDVEKIKSAPIKVDLHRKYPQFDKRILMASRLTHEKNIGLAIGAMREVIKNRPRTGLVIIGSGPEEKKLKAKSYELKANIIFESWTDDLASYYKTADLFLVTSFYEGYGRTIVEALACGCPVVSTDVGVAREVGATVVTDANLVDLIEKTLLTSKKTSLKNCATHDKQLYLKVYSSSWII